MSQEKWITYRRDGSDRLFAQHLARASLAGKGLRQPLKVLASDICRLALGAIQFQRAIGTRHYTAKLSFT